MPTSSELTRLTAIATLSFALMLAPSLFHTGGDVAEATTKKQCQAKAQGCGNRCHKNAGYKPGMSRQQFDQAFNEEVSCNNRTCGPQLNNCLANASDGSKKSAVKTNSSITSTPTRPGLLETSTSFSTTGPAATGAPIGGAAPGGGAAPVGGSVLRWVPKNVGASSATAPAATEERAFPAVSKRRRSAPTPGDRVTCPPPATPPAPQGRERGRRRRQARAARTAPAPGPRRERAPDRRSLPGRAGR